MIPLFEEPTVMARRALGQAQRSIAEGRGLEAVRMVKANSAYIPANAGTQRRLSSPSLQREALLRFSLGPGFRRDERGGVSAGSPSPD